MSIVFGLLAIVCQTVFFATLIQNVVRRESLTEWLLPGGVNKTEKIILSTSFILILIFAAAGALTDN